MLPSILNLKINYNTHSGEVKGTIGTIGAISQSIDILILVD